MEVSKIEALLLAVEKKSFSKAAEELSYTPSAFSHLVDSIEFELGVKILNRNFNGVELNENGKALLDKLNALVSAEKELLLSAKNLNCEDCHLRIGTYSSIAQHLLPDIINAFKQENPLIKVSIKVGNNLKTWLNDNTADVVFTDQELINANYIKIMSDPYMVLAPTNILVGKKNIFKDELYNLTCIIHNESIFKNYFEIDKFKDIVRFDSIDESSVVSMVEKNIGIAILPSLMLKNKPKHVHTIKLTPEISRTIGLAYKKESIKTKHIAKFIKFIQKTQREF